MSIRAASAVFLALAAAGCGGNRTTEPPPLGETDRALLQRAELLLRRGDSAWYPAWEELAARPVPRELFVRGLIAWLIQDYKSVSASPEVFGERLDSHPRAEQWRRILAGLARIGGPAAEQAWLFVRDGRDPFARTMGAEILGRLGPAALPVLLSGIESTELKQAVAAARGLGRQRGSAEALKALVRVAFSHPDYRVRGEALEALGSYGGPESQAELVRALQREREPFALRKAAEALGRLGEQAVAPVLIDYMERCKSSADAEGVQAAQRALSALSGRNLGQRPERWRLWWAERARSGESR